MVGPPIRLARKRGFSDTSQSVNPVWSAPFALLTMILQRLFCRLNRELILKGKGRWEEAVPPALA